MKRRIDGLRPARSLALILALCVSCQTALGESILDQQPSKDKTADKIAKDGERESRVTFKAAENLLGLAFAPDSRRLAAACKGVVEIRDVTTGKSLVTIRDDRFLRNAIAFSAKGDRVAIARFRPALRGDEVVIWDATTGKGLHALAGRVSPPTYALAFQSGKRKQVTAGGARTITTWDALTGAQLLSMRGGACSVSFSRDGKLLAAAAAGVTVPVVLWDARTGRQIRVLKDGGNNVAFSPDGKRVASVLRGTPTAKVWDVATGKELFRLTEHVGKLSSNLVFAPDGRHVMAAIGDKVHLWDAAVGVYLGEIGQHNGGRIFRLAISSDGKRIAGLTLGSRLVSVWTLKAALWRKKPAPRSK